MVCEIPFQLPCRNDLLSQHLPSKGVLYHTDLVTLQGKGFMNAAIATILTAIHDSSCKVYHG